MSNGVLSVSYTHLDVYKRQNVMSAIKYVAGSSLEVSAVISAIDYTLDKGKEYLNKAQDKASQNIMEGDLLGASANACLLYTSRCV